MPTTKPVAAKRGAKIGLVLAVATLLLIAHQTGVLGHFANPAEVKLSLVRLGAWGYLAFVVAYAALQPFGVPGTVFVMAAPLIWPWPVAFALSMTGTMAASVVGFGFARFVARDWVESKLSTKFKKYDEALAERGFSTVVLLRFIFWMPPMLHAFFGVSKVPFCTHFWGSLVGYAIPLFLVSFFGQELFDFASALPASTWIAIGAVVALLIVTVVLRNRRSNSAQSSE